MPSNPTLPVIILDLNGCEVRLDNKQIILYGTYKCKDSMDLYTPCHPEGIPKENDEHAFAQLYRTFKSLVNEKVLMGPFPIDRFLTYDFFWYFMRIPPKELLLKLQDAGVRISVIRIMNNKNIESIEKALEDFSPWMNGIVHVSSGSLDEELTRTFPLQPAPSTHMMHMALYVLHKVLILIGLGFALQWVFELYFYLGLILGVIYVHWGYQFAKTFRRSPVEKTTLN